MELEKLVDNSVDAVICDPPYGIGIDKWDKPLNLDCFFNLVIPKLKDTGFLVFFAQMPTMIDWVVMARQNKLKYLEHIIWVKRANVPSRRLSRLFENIFIFSKGNTKFYQTRGRYEDVKVEGLSLGLIDISGIKRYISAMQQEIKSGKPSMRSNKYTKSQPLYDRFSKDGSRFNRNPVDVNFTNVWSFQSPKQKNHNNHTYFHPTEKPVEVMERLLELTTEKGNIVLDPFAGSGSTLIAAKQLGRRYIGIEMSEEYTEIARRRLDNTSVQEEMVI